MVGVGVAIPTLAVINFSDQSERLSLSSLSQPESGRPGEPLSIMTSLREPPRLRDPGGGGGRKRERGPGARGAYQGWPQPSRDQAKLLTCFKISIIIDIDTVLSLSIVLLVVHYIIVVHYIKLKLIILLVSTGFITGINLSLFP